MRRKEIKDKYGRDQALIPSYHNNTIHVWISCTFFVSSKVSISLAQCAWRHHARSSLSSMSPRRVWMKVPCCCHACFELISKDCFISFMCSRKSRLPVRHRLQLPLHSFFPCHLRWKSACTHRNGGAVHTSFFSFMSVLDPYQCKPALTNSLRNLYRLRHWANPYDPLRHVFYHGFSFCTGRKCFFSWAWISSTTTASRLGRNTESMSQGKIGHDDERNDLVNITKFSRYRAVNSLKTQGLGANRSWSE